MLTAAAWARIPGGYVAMRAGSFCDPARRASCRSGRGGRAPRGGRQLCMQVSSWPCSSAGTGSGVGAVAPGAEAVEHDREVAAPEVGLDVAGGVDHLGEHLLDERRCRRARRRRAARRRPGRASTTSCDERLEPVRARATRSRPCRPAKARARAGRGRRPAARGCRTRNSLQPAHGSVGGERLLGERHDRVDALARRARRSAPPCRGTAGRRCRRRRPRGGRCRRA